MNKKKVLITLGCMILILLIVGISYAYWSLNFVQSENNVVTTDCFEIEFLESDAINLSKAYPVSDEDGLKNPPYNFTIKNLCDSAANYQINLETLIPSGKKLPDEYLRVSLTQRNVSDSIGKGSLVSYDKTDPTIEGAISAYRLLIGGLGPNETKEFSLKIWMSSMVTADMENSMNATYHGKVSIITSYKTPLTLIDTIKSTRIVTEGTGLYEVTHEDAEITYTDDENAINNLRLTELRYAGNTFNNYVNFNNELWRIIGLVNTPEGSRVKLIRSESIGSYSWDTSELSINGGSGVNEWSTSKIMDLLNNGAYYNRTSGICYNGIDNTTTECDFSETGLTSEAKNMIDTVTWNTGANNESNNVRKNFYNLERSNNTGKMCSGQTYCTDEIPRTTTWVGKIGLMYPSDYIYATSGESSSNREICLNALYWGNEIKNCEKNDWLYKSQMTWTMMPSANMIQLSDVYRISVSGNLASHDADANYSVFPVLYLKTNVKVTGGTGSVFSPYDLSI